MTHHRILTATLLFPELVFTTSRSSGPGGQNVNKVNTKVTLRFDVRHSRLLTDEEKNFLSHKLAARLTTEGEVIITCQDNRSQLQNREEAVQKFDRLLAKAFEKKKVRKSTKPSKRAVQKRIDAKKHHSLKKQNRDYHSRD